MLVIIIGIAIFVLGGAYILFSASPSTPAPAKEGALTEDSTPAATAERQFLSLVASLEPTHLDTKLLSDARFTSLSDIREPVLPEATGRLNPFATFSK
jgi:hypothetical protein